MWIICPDRIIRRPRIVYEGVLGIHTCSDIGALSAV